MAATPSTGMPNANMYNPPRPPEVYTLLDPVNDAIPEEVRHLFSRDENGRVLFFTAPPLDRANNGVAPDSARLGHSAKYLAGRKDWLAERERKRKERDEQSTNPKKRTSSQDGKESELLSSEATNAMRAWFHDFDRNTEAWKKTAGVEGWREPVQG